jgi:CDP-diacylglycerol---glycerol-3-phosphate 3-phosphatidyltransferase
MNIPNYLSMLRVVLIPFLVGAYYLPFSWGHNLAAALFIVAAISDWLDGFLARKLNQSTPFGAFIDPVADKLIVAATIILIVGKGDLPYLTLPAIVIIGREIAVSALREWMAEVGSRDNVAVSYLGKIKTVLQLMSLIVLLYSQASSPLWITIIGYTLFYTAALLTLWSMIVYFKAALPQLRLK